MTARPQESVSFDCVADQYEATRSLPAGVAAKQTDTIAAELRNAGAKRLLEVGIGTGLVSRPLMGRDIRVTGVDISPRMLGRLREQLRPEHRWPDLLLGDATRLPFTDNAFPAVVVSHVFHVVSDVERTLDEIRRVLAPGNIFLHDRTVYSAANPWAASHAKREELMASLGVDVRHRPTAPEIERCLVARGGSLRVVRYASSAQRGLAESLIRNARSNMFAWAWDVPDDAFRQFLVEYDGWCREYYGNREYEITHEMEVWAFK